jgi:anti-sigma regulatory factor (Ser/Thr protein kinase)
VSGRGLLLMRTFMDDVSFNSTGNQVTMVKRCSAAPALAEATP